MAEGKSERGYRTIKLKLKTSDIAVYTSPRLATALEEITTDMNLYQGVRFTQILEAVYQQGRKDGAAAVFKEIDKGVKEAQRLIPHRRPGRPKKAK